MTYLIEHSITKRHDRGGVFIYSRITLADGVVWEMADMIYGENPMPIVKMFDEKLTRIGERQ